jgi:cytochrome c-type biogenesis protein CcmH/NrfG
MPITAILSAVLLTQAWPATAPESTERQADAAYEQLAAGDNASAIAHLEQALQAKPGDPAMLINLGTAYSRAGEMEKARAAFTAAMNSDSPYSVELADGTWEDSRKIARLALQSLDRAAFAAR